jgi:hypothetical protein
MPTPKRHFNRIVYPPRQNGNMPVGRVLNHRSTLVRRLQPISQITEAKTGNTMQLFIQGNMDKAPTENAERKLRP